ncbi:MAG: outer membrane protein assembly factor BamA, partial [Kiritimatiellae bacterium]|nr:outer membrane protein assembly factor BamA [Kiritimatiellia bacterium]
VGLREALVDDLPDGGLDLVFSVLPRRTLAAEPTFEGRKRVGRSAALKALDLKPGDFVDDDVLGAAAAKLRELYVKRRFFDAKVTPRLEPAAGNPGAAYAVFAVEEGEKCRADFLAFPGATAISEDSLGRYAQQHDWYNPQSWIYTPRLSDVDLDAVAGDARRQYLDAGYLDATVSAPRKERDGRRLKVSYDVVEGPVYRVGSIAFEGVTLFPEADLRRELPLRTGDVAGAAAMEDARKAVQDHFASRGYPGTAVALATSPSAAAENALDLLFRVEEGPLVRIRSVNVRGNTVTKDKVIRRETVVDPGAPYDSVATERSRRRLMNLGYFEDVRVYDSPAGEGWADLFYDVDEKRTGSIMFGAGFSSVDHLIGMFQVSQSNFDLFNWPTFRGGGQKARLDLTLSEDSTDLDVSFVEPWFLDRRLSLDTDFFIHNREYDEYDERRIGATAGLSKMVPWVGRVGLDYGIEHVRLDDVTKERFVLADDPETEYSFLDEDDAYLLGFLRLAWTYDTRDNPLVPRRGTRATAHAKLYNGAFGSDYDFWELNAKAYTYFSLPFGFTLSLSGRAATVDGIGGDDVPIGSRYFLGGGRYVRGFRHRAIGPKALSLDYEGDYASVGGRSLLWGTAELSVPTPVSEKIRLAAFYDVGNVWTDSWDWDLGDLAATCGGGLRFDFVGFPIRLDYAHIVEAPDDYARKRRFVFWIGFDN